MTYNRIYVNVELLLRFIICSRTPRIRIKWDGEPPGYAENPNNWGFLGKWATLAEWVSAVTIYIKYLLINLSTTPDLKFQKP